MQKNGAIFDTTMSMLPHACKQCKSAFYHLRTISRIRKYLSTQATEILIHAFVTSKLDHCNSLPYNVPKNVIKSFNRSRMQLPEWLHGLGSVITSLPSASIFTGYLFLNELNSRFYYLPSKLCISNLRPTFKSLSPATYLLDRFGHPLRSVWILVSFNLKTYGSRAFSVSAPELWSKLPDDIRSCENLSLFRHKLKTYLFTNFYFSH